MVSAASIRTSSDSPSGICRKCGSIGGWRKILPGSEIKLAAAQNLLMHAFGRPQGVLGRLGGIIMARMNADFGMWVAGFLEIGPADHVLEVGFGPGAVIQRLSQDLPTALIAGV